MHIHDKVMHDLLCSSLREFHFGRVESDVIEVFNYQLCVALHNIPHQLRENGCIDINTCLEINNLDPSSKEGEWGDWVNAALTTLSQKTEYPK